MTLPLWIPVAAGLAGAASLYPWSRRYDRRHPDKFANKMLKRRRQNGFVRQVPFKRFRTFQPSKMIKSRRQRIARRYRRVAFQGRPFGLRTLPKLIESHKFKSSISATTTLTHTAGDDFQWVNCSIQEMEQANTAAKAGTFTGNAIFLVGISFKFILGSLNANANSLLVRMQLFRSHSKMDCTGVWFVETDDTQIAGGNDEDLKFYDVNYNGATSHAELLLATPRKEGPVLLKTWNWRINSGNEGDAAKIVRGYVPLNQVYKFQDDNDLATDPNHGKHGSYFFVLTFDSVTHAMDQAATTPSLVFAQGSNFTYYYKDA